MIPFLRSLVGPFTRTEESDRTSAGFPKDAGLVTGFFYIAVICGLGLVVAFAGDVKGASVAVLWAFACFSSGTFIGFLFGVPRIQQSENGRPGAERSGTYQQKVNTNLTEISDWLTKIIVGLGLINLNKIPPLLKKASEYLSRGIPGATDITTKEPLALALIMFFSVMGFLFGYLSTRLFLAPAFSRADQQAAETLRRQQQEIDSTTAQLAAVTTAVRVLGSPSEDSPVGKDEEGQRPQSGAESTEPTKASEITEKSSAKSFGQRKLLELAKSYTEIESPDYMERVQRKDKAADEMAALALRSRISKDWIAQQAEASGSDGLIVALASIASVAPDSSDLERILRVSGNAKWKHTKFRVAVAISNLFSQNLASPTFVEPVLGLLSNFKRGADGPLLKMISQTQASISRFSGHPNALP